jgi:hypothetical protein
MNGDAFAQLDALEHRLTRNREQLAALRAEVGRMLRVYEAAKRFVLSPLLDDAAEDRLRDDLGEAVHAAIAAEPVRERPAPTRTPSAGVKRMG